VTRNSSDDIAKVLITGGAGFIGSTVASACLDRGITPVILDSLITGRREFTAGRIFFEGDISDGAVVDKIFAEHPDIGAVVHCAALIVVPDSVANPLGYYRANVVKSLDMVEHLLRNGCTRLVFSSSAAIYSPGADLSVDETSPIGPTSPYAQTKAVCEQMFADIAAAGPLRVMSVRYFNPIGADPQLRTGLQVREPTHALGRLILAQQAGQPFHVTGTDYPTRDGTGIRDYVHVWDLAEAHLRALGAFDRALSGRTSTVINLGTGTGTTVRELVTAFNRVSGSPVATVDAARRPGDAAGAFTRSDLAAAELGWRTRFSLADGIRDALRWVAVRDQILAEDRT
jgi:UDP-glucose 4-epimerase